MSSTANTCVTEVTSAISRIKMVPPPPPPPKHDVSLPTHPDLSPDTGIDIREDISANTFRLQTINSSTSHVLQEQSLSKIQIPIVGYEVMEERARFTVFKLRIENKNTGECWFVFRRYTDFVRLQSRLKTDFPSVKLSLPRKRWFGDNFDPEFLEQRIEGLQCFVDGILEHEELCSAPSVKDFFCLDEPPSYAESVEESRAIFESLEETIYHLRYQLREKESELHKLREKEGELRKLRSSLVSETMKKEVVCQFIRDCMKDCPRCTEEFSKLDVTDAESFSSSPIKLLGARDRDNENSVHTLQSTPVIKCDSLVKSSSHDVF